MEEPLKVLEFYSGIGGMHYALNDTNVSYKVLGAFDINTTANIVYKYNFPDTKLLQKNIEGFSVEYLDTYKADVWTMSPPCQPYTRQGKQEASNDARAKSFINILKILRSMENPPKYIFLENVKGFEVSDTRELLLSALKSRNYVYQEFLISPSDLGIPNSRTRYYIAAKHNSTFEFVTTSTPFSVGKCDSKEGDNTTPTVTTGTLGPQEFLDPHLKACEQREISDFLGSSANEDYMLNKDVVTRYHSILDIVHKGSTRSCCFTKAYGKYVEGTGSVLTEKLPSEVTKVYDEVSNTTNNDDKYRLLSALQMRYFTPAEIGRLMCFPDEFHFPDEITLKQKYRLLGNSVNVFVISCLMKWVLFDD